MSKNRRFVHVYKRSDLLLKSFGAKKKFNFSKFSSHLTKYDVRMTINTSHKKFQSKLVQPVFVFVKGIEILTHLSLDLEISYSSLDAYGG